MTAAGPLRFDNRWPAIGVERLPVHDRSVLDQRDRQLEDYVSNVEGRVTVLEADDATYGTATLDFGATGSQEATVAVTGQTGIEAGSKVWCWLAGTTADNDEYSHAYATQVITLGVVSVTPGVGFTIRGINREQAATETWNVNWGWA